MKEDMCQYHMQDHQVTIDLKDSVKTIIDGQLVMHTSIVQLTEAFKGMDRLETRLEKIEESRKEQEDKQDQEIKELRAFMNRSLGWAAAGVLGLGIALRVVGMI